jgi:hypothetical protein
MKTKCTSPLALIAILGTMLIAVATFTRDTTQATITFPTSGEATLTIAASNAQATSDEFIISHDNSLNLDVDDQASGAISSFVVQLKDTSTGNWYSYFGDSDFVNTADPRLKFSSTVPPYQTAAATQSHAKIDIGHTYSVRFLVTLASGTGNVVVKASNYAK